MQRALFWFLFGVMFTFAMMLMVFGVLFMRDVYVSAGSGSGEVAFTSLLFGMACTLEGMRRSVIGLAKGGRGLLRRRDAGR